MKRFYALILTLIIIFSFAGCTGGSKDASTATDLTQKQLEQLIKETTKG